MVEQEDTRILGVRASAWGFESLYPHQTRGCDGNWYTWLIQIQSSEGSTPSIRTNRLYTYCGAEKGFVVGAGILEP